MMSKDEPRPTTTSTKAQLHETIAALLHAAHTEMQELSKKKPDATISSNKAKVLNRLLTDAQTILKDENSAKYLDLIDEEATLPHHSDVVLMLSQYAAAMTSFKKRYYGLDPKTHDSKWFVE